MSSQERDFSWFDWTNPSDILPDGSAFLFHEAGVGGGIDFGQFLRKTDGSPPVLLGSGNEGYLSPDGKTVMNTSAHSPSQIFLYPIGAGEKRQVTHDAIDHSFAVWMPDGKHILYIESEPGHSAEDLPSGFARGRPQGDLTRGFHFGARYQGFKSFS